MAVVRPGVALLLASVLVAAISPTKADDVFIGTLSFEGDNATLKRCDLAQNVYLLRDADGADAVAALRKRPLASKGYWYGEVIGEYVEVDGRDGLLVSSIESIAADRSCHLSDALGGIEASALHRHAEPANSAGVSTRSSSED